RRCHRRRRRRGHRHPARARRRGRGGGRAAGGRGRVGLRPRRRGRARRRTLPAVAGEPRATRGGARSPVTESKLTRAYRHIAERIEDGRFAPGHRLVLAPLAEELGMSVVPVREAIRLLEAEGLVTFERNVGAQVAMINADEYMAAYDALTVVESAAIALGATHM